MVDKAVGSAAAAVAAIEPGMTVMVSGFGDPGVPNRLLDAVVERGCGELELISNNAGSGDHGVAALLRAGLVRRIVCSYPRSYGSVWFERAYRAGEVELEVVPQGTLSERIRAGGAGIGGFYTPTGVGTVLAEGRETRTLEGRLQVLETPLRADVALIRARAADRVGNVVYHAAARNYGPTMAAAAAETVVEVDEVLAVGELDPETVVTPGIFVDRVYAAAAEREEEQR